jgi:predicted RNA binding protein YcfA (HicA-like mRNA interferase family)
MVRLYELHGWRVVRQNGSHVRMVKGPEHETIPMHKELKKGTEHDLLKRLGVKK